MFALLCLHLSIEDCGIDENALLLHCQLRKISIGKCKHTGNMTSLSPKGSGESPVADHYTEYYVFLAWSLQRVALLHHH